MSTLTLFDRVWETSTTTGTGTLTLLGAKAGYQSFAVVGDGNTTYYCISDGTNFEVGVGTYTASGTTLSRDTIYASSNGNALVNFGAGIKDVFLTLPAKLATQITVEDTFLTAEPISGGRAVGITTSGYVQIAMAAVAGRTPAVGIVADNITSGSTARIYTRGRVNSTLFNFSGYIGSPIWVGTSGEIVTSGGPLQSGNVQQPIGVVTSFSGLLLQTIMSGAITASGNIGSGQIGATHLSSGAVMSGAVASGQISNFKMASGAVNSGHVASGAILGQAGGGAFTVASGTINTFDIGSGGIRSGNVASGQVGFGHLANASVQSGTLASGTVSRFHVASGAVNSGHVASGAILGQAGGGAFTIASGSINTFDIGSGGIQSGNVASGQLGFGHLANASVQSGTLASGVVSRFHHASGAVNSGHVASGAVLGQAGGGAFTIASGSINTFDIGSGGIQSGNVASGQVGFGHLANASVQSGTVASGTVSRFHMASGAVNSGHVASGAVLGQAGGGALNIASGTVSTYDLASGATITRAQYVGTLVSGTSWSAITEEPVSGVRAVSLSPSGNIRIAMASVPNRMPAIGVVDGNVASGIAANVFAIGTLQFTSGMGDYSGYVGQTVYVGRSGQIVTTSGSFNSGGLLSGDILQPLGTIVNSGAVVVQTQAVYVSGGLPLGSGVVLSGAIASGQVGFGHLANASVQSGTLASGVVSQFHHASGAINSGHVASGAVLGQAGGGAFTIASGTINTFDIGSGGIQSGNVASGQVGFGHLANASVQSGTLASGVVSRFHHASGAVNSGHVGSGAVLGQAGGGAFTIASGTINTFDIGSGGIQSGNVASGQVGFGHLANASVQSGTLASGVVSRFHHASGAVNSGHVASGAVLGQAGGGAFTIASGTINTFDIGSGGIQSGNVASGQVGFGHLANASVQSGTLASGVVSRFHHASGAVNSGHVASGAVLGQAGGGAFTIASGTVNTFDIGSGGIQSGNVASGQLGFGHLANASVQSGTLASGVVSRFHHASGAVNSGHVASGAVLGQAGGGAFTIASGTIGTLDIGSGAIVSGLLGSGQVGSFHIASGAVGSGRLAVAGTPDGTKLLRDDFTWTTPGAASVNSGDIGSGKIASGAVQGFFGTTRDIASGTVGVWDFGSGAIQSGAIASGQVGGGHVASGSLNTYNLASGTATTAALFVMQSISGTAWANITEEIISGGRVVSMSPSGNIRIAMSSVSGRMPAVGVVFDNVASGITANVYTLGNFQFTSGMGDYSGYVGQQVYVGRSGQIVTTSGSFNSGGLLSGDITQAIGVAAGSGSATINLAATLPFVASLITSGNIASGTNRPVPPRLGRGQLRPRREWGRARAGGRWRVHHRLRHHRHVRHFVGRRQVRHDRERTNRPVSPRFGGRELRPRREWGRARAGGRWRVHHRVRHDRVVRLWVGVRRIGYDRLRPDRTIPSGFWLCPIGPPDQRRDHHLQPRRRGRFVGDRRSHQRPPGRRPHLGKRARAGRAGERPENAGDRRYGGQLRLRRRCHRHARGPLQPRLLRSDRQLVGPVRQGAIRRLGRRHPDFWVDGQRPTLAVDRHGDLRRSHGAAVDRHHFRRAEPRLLKETWRPRSASVGTFRGRAGYGWVLGNSITTARPRRHPHTRAGQRGVGVRV
jgi:hypothetical protein